MNIGQFILEQSEFFSLSSVEHERTSDFLKDLEESDPVEIENVQSVTGENSVILSRERFSPRDGVLIQPPEEKD